MKIEKKLLVDKKLGRYLFTEDVIVDGYIVYSCITFCDDYTIESNNGYIWLKDSFNRIIKGIFYKDYSIDWHCYFEL